MEDVPSLTRQETRKSTVASSSSRVTVPPATVPQDVAHLQTLSTAALKETLLIRGENVRADENDRGSDGEFCDTPKTLWDAAASQDGKSQLRVSPNSTSAANRLLRTMSRPVETWMPKGLNGIKALAGRWVHKRSAQRIQGGMIMGPDGTVARLKRMYKDKFSVMLRGSTYTARLLGSALFWDDGDVWIREKPGSPIEGSWSDKTHLAIAQVITGEYLHKQDGTSVKIAELHPGRISVPFPGGTRQAMLADDRLIWDSGEIWLRATGQKPFDGRWTHKSRPGLVQLIQGDTLYGADGIEIKLVFLSKNRLAMKLKNRVYQATLVGDDLVWDDGDVWERIADQVSIDGSWIQRSNRTPTETVQGEVVVRPDGSEATLTYDDENGLRMHHGDRVFTGRIVGDELAWSDGDTWIRKGSPEQEVNGPVQEPLGTGNASDEDDSIQADAVPLKTKGFRKVLRNNSVVTGLIPFIPFGFVAFWLGWPSTLSFLLNLSGIIPATWFLGKSLEELSKTFPGTFASLVAGHRNAVTEILVCLACIRQRHLTIIPYLLFGFVATKLLLILGAALVWGAVRFGDVSLDADGNRLYASSLLLAVLFVVMSTIHNTLLQDDQVTLTISRGFTMLLLSLYVQFLFFCHSEGRFLFAGLRDDANEKQDFSYAAPGLGQVPRLAKGEMSLPIAVAVLVLSFGLTLCMCEYMLWSLPAVAEAANVDNNFIGTVIIPFFTTLPHHAIVSASSSEAQEAVSFVVSSACQVLLLISPLAVFAGWACGLDVFLKCDILLTSALVLVTMMTSQLASARSASWVQGAALIFAYFIMITCLLYNGEYKD